MEVIMKKPKNNESIKLSNCYEYARKMILLIVIATVINNVATLYNTHAQFLFSMTLPFYLPLADVLYITETVPRDEISDALSSLNTSEYLNYIIIVVSAIILISISVFFWYKSKNLKYGWLIGMLALYAFDFLAYIDCAGFDFDATCVCHMVAIGFLLAGIISAIRFKIKTSASE